MRSPSTPSGSRAGSRGDKPHAETTASVNVTYDDSTSRTPSNPDCSSSIALVPIDSPRRAGDTSAVETLGARLATSVADLLRRRQRVLVAIDGPDCAGKTTLADRLAVDVGEHALRASIDGFHNPAHIRRQRGHLSPEGYYRDSFDHASLTADLLEPFSRGDPRVQSVRYAQRGEEPARVDLVGIPPSAILVFDGVFLLQPELRHFWTLAVYLAVAPEETMRRALMRDADLFGSRAELERRYTERYLPGQALYRQEATPEARARVVIDNSGPTAPAILRWSPPADGS